MSMVIELSLFMILWESLTVTGKYERIDNKSPIRCNN
jgi:hypothetical protein